MTPASLASVTPPIAEPDALRAIADLATAINQINLNIVAMNGRFDLLDQRIAQNEEAGGKRGRDLEKKIESEVRGIRNNVQHDGELAAQESSAQRAALTTRVAALEDTVAAAKATGGKIAWAVFEKVLTVGVPWGAVAAILLTNGKGPTP